MAEENKQDYLELRRAAEAILSQCDGAKEKDGVGFGALHADKVPEMLKENPMKFDTASYLHNILKIYKKQLKSLNIDYDSIPKPKKPALNLIKIAEAIKTIIENSTGIERLQLEEYLRARFELSQAKYMELKLEVERTVNQKKATESSPEAIANALKKFEDPDLLLHVHEELSKRHLWDTKQKMTAFLAACTAFLENPKHRVSVAFLGDSSCGKDNLMHTILDLMPETALFLTNATQAALEDDSERYKIIGFSEQNTNREDGANIHLVEAVKQMSEGGMAALKKDTATGFKETKLAIQEQKCVFYGTTEERRDEETETRFLCIPIPKQKEKIKSVNDHTLDSYAKTEWTGVDTSWITLGQDEMAKNPVKIIIPYAPLLKELIDDENARAQRDLKRVMCLTEAMTWLHQKQRTIVEVGVNKLVISEPEDFLNVLTLCEDFLNQSYVGLEQRLQSIIDIAEKKYERDKEFLRSELQKEVGIKALNTFKRRLKILQEKGEIEFVRMVDNKNVYYKLPETSPNRKSLITHKGKEGVKLPVHNISKPIQKEVWIPECMGEKWIEIKEKLTSKYKVVQTQNIKPILVASLTEKESIEFCKFLVKLDTSQMDTSPKTKEEPPKTEPTPEQILLEKEKFIKSIKSGELAGKSMPKLDFILKINHDTDLFQKWLHDGTIGDSGGEVWIV